MQACATGDRCRKRGVAATWIEPALQVREADPPVYSGAVVLSRCSRPNSDASGHGPPSAWMRLTD